ncbi:hypothetical protein NEFER03_2154 [Nematocida sp. LUAm3]|nr:hypothetical protein NEFER03_2154 [Nematocida sp. LUAm3]KAI5174625.1 hypothetical protein NEFER02_0746 [Nematocida sp. LUAm2]KAI5177969.1 hypothetical protein NEFER01_1151 [Nematocida sp. LUAm1]
MDEFEKKHVHLFYEESSKEFSATRYKMWPKVEYFYEKYVKPSDLILDAGCGNGRNTLFPERTYSIDYSRGLLNIAKNKNGLGYGRVDLSEEFSLLPGKFDVILSIAVIHHLSTEERRSKSIENMAYSLKKGGVMLVYVWSESPQAKSSKFVGVSNVLSDEIKNINLKITSNDVFVGWKKKNELNRYYHLFKEDELVSLLKKHSLTILEEGCDHGNYFAICRK